MSDRRFGAFFFLLRKEPMPSLQELATAAGVTSLALWPWSRNELHCGQWACDLSVDVHVHHLSMHDCLALDFLQGSFLDLLPVREGNEDLPLEEDGALPVAIAFRDACERLRPEAAVLATHPHMLQEPQWLRDCYSAVLGMDPNLLDVHQGGLTYVGPDMVDEWEPGRFGEIRDSLPVKEGKLLFRGTGWGRWF